MTTPSSSSSSNKGPARPDKVVAVVTGANGYVSHATDFDSS